MGIIEAKKLIFEYIRRDEEGNVEGITRAVDEVDLDIKQGDFVAILGHNGSGKSTLAKHLNAILYPTEGTVWVDGKDTAKEEYLWDIRQNAGMVFQNPDNQFIGATVRDDIAFGLENKCVPQKDMEDIINYYAKEVNMYAFLDHEPSKLSGGQKQRVAIAGILAMQPDILILDESTSMLDPKGKTEVNALVKKIRQEKKMTVLSITHDIEEASKADRIILLNKGRIEAIGSPKEILSDANKLEELGLEAPFSFQLSKQLQNIGIDVSLYIDEKGLVEELCQLRLKK